MTEKMKPKVWEEVLHLVRPAVANENRILFVYSGLSLLQDDSLDIPIDDRPATAGDKGLILLP